LIGSRSTGFEIEVDAAQKTESFMEPYWRFVGKMVVKKCERILIESYFEAVYFNYYMDIVIFIYFIVDYY
jgi:hypothetical protein